MRKRSAFATALDTFVQQLPIRAVVLGNVYDPTFSDDRRNFVGVLAGDRPPEPPAHEHCNSRDR
ncbi:hypothetical protein H6G97_50740 [Nostoc flagelliforme FACHB-838]|uniref:Uncharacterized protein n=1 Tax=Nostoc flagelliforme FACHB-838 TaxID=2692904 RepID=A0ABR8E7H1_9NOSO|nr:hypothetical protein [Nostoc flagelliforme]MBD2537041.1 hypothetical protein [Nostoc flagelliforme FACHB-838]